MVAIILDERERSVVERKYVKLRATIEPREIGLPTDGIVTEVEHPETAQG